MAHRALGLVSAAVLAALALAASSAANVLSPVVHVTVTPRVISPHSDVTVRFHQPSQTALLPDDRVTESLRVTGSSTATGCIDHVQMALAPTAPGTLVQRTMRPGNIARWCLGSFRGEITLAEYLRCNPGPVRGISYVCPLYVVAPRTIATFRFRVTAP